VGLFWGRRGFARGRGGARGGGGAPPRAPGRAPRPLVRRARGDENCPSEKCRRATSSSTGADCVHRILRGLLETSGTMAGRYRGMVSLGDAAVENLVAVDVLVVMVATELLPGTPGWT